MGSLTWLDDATPFPHPDQALPEGLLAAGADLSLARLEQAYRHGIFPWFNEGDPILWWSPDPRMVLPCADLRISHSLNKLLHRVAREERRADARVRITTDLATAEVLDACAAPRRTQHATWISPLIKQAYMAWHRAGAVHSVETWLDGDLAGGLYGVCLGRFFFGESMFSRASDTSKIALAYLVRFLESRGVRHIDCQQQTDHLASLGARPMPRDAFLSLLRPAVAQTAPVWQPGQLLHTGQCLPLPAPCP
ncbi:leucyl/phenylalanyl-tRNA--protein transferase [Allopusillimonas soli]|uniref:Leucyl/phenylalanyl-tRNA--protein transferase n=1 Tax=Allopusillimonas soli TaxID=659016 RepID=A0A853FH03_9BURK|nr:leucyl/phenylalanyl-tRNA--protein transferase [Allopusillimonas soli]NYT39008.1 leucyl/phenylalanyl-tRNA--protein transferase [Allopusillimonas soli]TEA69552.1 leucyl/phenylalanyl-tRNA--protein transferase [Allopusillimonas soli]